MKVRKTDRRTLMTKSMIKYSLLELLQNTPYDKITVTSLCRQAEITRTTFYLHYDNIDDVLDELLDDALRLTELNAFHPAVSIATDPDASLPACQRAASDPKYQILFLDENLSHHILKKLYLLQKPYKIPEIMENYHVTEWEADKLFLFMLHGNFAVNKALNWTKNADWYRIQDIIDKILQNVE